MAQAGWYNAPGEPGMLRYWGGEAWTDHRQPAPAPVAVPAPVAALAPVAMPAPVAVPALVPAFQPRPDPYGQDLQGTTVQTAERPPAFHEGINLGLSFDGIPIGPGSLSQLPDVNELKLTFANKVREAQANAATQSKSTALKGAISSILVGLVMIVIGASLLLFFSQEQSVGPGEASVQGTVFGHIGLGSECKPEVEFPVDGHNYQAFGGVGGSCTTDLVDDTVTVIYSVANPANTGRYIFGNPAEPFVLALPVLGAVVLVSGVVAFVRRLARRRSQFA